MKLTTKQKDFREDLLKLIHLHDIYKTQFANNRENWVELLKREFDKESSKDLSITQLSSLLNFLKTGKFFEFITDEQYAELTTLWVKNKTIKRKTIRALSKFIQNITGKKCFGLRTMHKNDATKVIVALNNMKRTM